jgi:hypothetical protein
VALGVGAGVGFEVGAGVGSGAGFCVGTGVGVGVGVGAGVAAGGRNTVTVPPAMVSVNLSRSIARNSIWWPPTGSFELHVNRTPAFQSEPSTVVIAWATPSTTTWRLSGSEPSRLR